MKEKKLEQVTCRRTHVRVVGSPYSSEKEKQLVRYKRVAEWVMHSHAVIRQEYHVSFSHLMADGASWSSLMH